MKKRHIMAMASCCLAALLTACGTSSSKPADPSQPKLLADFPDAKVLPISSLHNINPGVRAFREFPTPALRNFPLEAPKVGCAMVEILIGKDGTVNRTAIAESYPRGIFNAAASRDASFYRFTPQQSEVITYQFYQFNIDEGRDTGAVKTYRNMGAVEVLFEVNFKRRYERAVKGRSGTNQLASGIVRMPKKCKTLYNLYASFPDTAPDTAQQPEPQG